MQLPLMDRYGLYFASSQLICVGQFTDRASSCTSALEATLDLNIDLQNIKNKKNVSLLMWKKINLSWKLNSEIVLKTYVSENKTPRSFGRNYSHFRLSLSFFLGICQHVFIFIAFSFFSLEVDSWKIEIMWVFAV